MGGLAVAAGASRLLEVVLEGAGYVRVDDNPDVGLVHAHAEGSGGADGPEFAAGEAALGGLLLFGLQLAVEVVGLHPVGGQVLGRLSGGPAGGAVDDGAAVAVGHVAFEGVPDLGQLVLAGGAEHVKHQVGPAGAAVHLPEVQRELAVEVVVYLLFDFGLGRGGEA